jgi:hypothetical protein
MQFGRVLACYIINQKDKIDWKRCAMERKDEEDLAKQFRKEYEAKEK